jgi:hypothetical protein
MSAAKELGRSLDFAQRRQNKKKDLTSLGLNAIMCNCHMSI